MDDWGSAGVPPAGSGVAPELLGESFNLGEGFRRDAENGDRDGRAPQSRGNLSRQNRMKADGAHARGWAITEIKFEPPHFFLKFLNNQGTKQPRRQNFVPLLLCCSTAPHSYFQRSEDESARRIPNAAGTNGARGARTRLGDDGNQI
jgi:hypothetical protein